MENIEKRAHTATIGTFWLTALILLLMGVQIFQGRQKGAETTPQGNPKTAQVAPALQWGGIMHWIMPSILAVSILVAGGLNFAASRQRAHKESASNPNAPPAKCVFTSLQIEAICLARELRGLLKEAGPRSEEHT